MVVAVRGKIRRLDVPRAVRGAVLVVTGTAGAIVGNIVPQLGTWPLRIGGTLVVGIGIYVGIRVSSEPEETDEPIVERAGVGLPPPPHPYVADPQRTADRLRSTLMPVRVIGVVGEAGIGKSTHTAMALNTPDARRLFDDRRYWADLERSPANVPNEEWIYRAVGASSRAGVEDLLRLKGPSVLVVDHFELLVTNNRPAAADFLAWAQRLIDLSTTVIIVCQGRPELLIEAIETISPEAPSQGGALAMFALLAGLGDVDDRVARLLDEVGRLPRAIMLLANAAKEGGVDELLRLVDLIPALSAHEASDRHTNIGLAIES